MSNTRVLFVEDEPALRTTLPALLEQHGFEVRTAATVTEALRELQSQSFQLLITDLNIGEPGDGFTVVSAMRRTQPDCVNFILTGYPAFEAALRAIQSQVDDYLVKPTDVGALVAAMQHRLSHRRPMRARPLKRVPMLLRENTEEIVHLALAQMKSQPKFGALKLPDHELVDLLPALLVETAMRMEAAPEGPAATALVAAARHGSTRREQGYTLDLLLDEARLLDYAIHQAVQKHLLSLDLSTLIPDLGAVAAILRMQLSESVRGYLRNHHGYLRTLWDRISGFPLRRRISLCLLCAILLAVF